MKVAIFYGSKSDTEIMSSATSLLKEFAIPYSVNVASAHRIPETLSKILSNLEKEGVEVIIAGAGLAAHLPGVIASQTTVPVIGVPIKSQLDGMDALLSIVQMPKPIPVATVGINNSFNAAMLAIEILALKYDQVKAKLIDYRTKMKAAFIKENEIKE